MRKKVSRLLLYVALCTVCAVTKAQNVSKSFENQSLKSVLTEIEHQTGLSIIYELKEVDETKKITGYFKNTPVEQVLSEILDKDLTFTIRNKMILLSKRKNEKRQQEGVKRVTGKVIDEKGEAVIGATVLVKGTTNGTITDVDGIFTLDNVPSDALIAISYIGYQDRELSVKDKQSVNVTLSGVGCGAAGVTFGSAFFISAFWGSATSALVSVWAVLDTSVTGAASCFTLRGRPGLRLGASVSVAGVEEAAVSLAVSTVCAEACVAGVSPVFPFVSSPFLLAVNTLSAPSFLTVTRERFCLSPLRSSFNLSAATFLVAPAIACSSRIL